MRIGIAHIEYGLRGGIERASTELADRLARAGNEVHYHAHRWQTVTRSPITFHRVAVIPWPHSAELASFAWWASRQLGPTRYDITHSHGSVAGCDVITAHSCHLAGMRARGTHTMAGSQRNWGITDSLLLRRERKNFGERRYRKVIAVAQGVRRELSECYGVPDDDMVVIPNGVDLDAFSPDVRVARRDESRRQLGLARDDTVVLFVGNEFERKGLTFALDAMAIAKTSNQKLLVAGKDDPAPYQRYARNLGIAPNVLFAGASDDMPSIFAAADLFLLPTSYEAFSLALLEAAATGLPIVTTRVNGAEELVQERENGIFVTQDPLGIARAIRLLTENSELRLRLGHAARTAALQYSWDLVTQKTLKVYEDVVEQKRKGPGR